MILKRVCDILISSIGLISLIPLFVIISIIIKLSSKGPVFFVQNRVGKNGDIFSMIKFRSMTIQQDNLSTVSIYGDSRITNFGFFLRRYKLDELPELFNVLKGEMSLVGPRPDVPGYADKLVGEAKLILLLRPGITGPATLKYANEEKILASCNDPVKYNDEIIYPDKVKINLDYYYNNSIWIDFKIIFATIFRKNY
ncbi:MAG: sugar transferase [Bacteroidota bacterium]|nr:sugar transferase [Bacteroidota bacterium]